MHTFANSEFTALRMYPFHLADSGPGSRFSPLIEARARSKDNPSWEPPFLDPKLRSEYQDREFRRYPAGRYIVRTGTVNRDRSRP